eukprot:SM000010S04268  [mRNA]  locus=s10:648149:651787:+ [translate_table: standard]
MTQYIPYFAALTTYFSYGLLFIFGHLRDFLRSVLRPKRAPQGYAPLCRDFEDFYTRRLYHRIQDCWNRPIASAPDNWIDVIERSSFDNNQSLHRLPKHLKCLNLGSYNYLGFAATDPYCTQRVIDSLVQYGASTCSNRMDAGNTMIHVELEQLVARFVGKQAAMVYGMGFATNSMTFPVLVGKGGLIVSDSLNHASIVAGARGSGAKVVVFKHNVPEHLELVLREAIADGQPRTHRPWKKIIIIVEGIYSMEGEVCRLPEIVTIKEKYKELIAYLNQKSPAHIHGTSMSPPAAMQVISAFKVLLGEDGSDRGLRKLAQLRENSNWFRSQLRQIGCEVLGDEDSPVMPLMLYNPAKIAAFSRECLKRNVAVVVVGFPATPLLLSRARICISAAHTREDLERGLQVIDEVSSLCKLKYMPVEQDMVDLELEHCNGADLHKLKTL